MITVAALSDRHRHSASEQATCLGLKLRGWLVTITVARLKTETKHVVVQLYKRPASPVDGRDGVAGRHSRLVCRPAGHGRDDDEVSLPPGRLVERQLQSDAGDGGACGRNAMQQQLGRWSGWMNRRACTIQRRR